MRTPGEIVTPSAVPLIRESMKVLFPIPLGPTISRCLFFSIIILVSLVTSLWSCMTVKDVILTDSFTRSSWAGILNCLMVLSSRLTATLEASISSAFSRIFFATSLIRPPLCAKKLDLSLFSWIPRSICAFCLRSLSIRSSICSITSL